MTYISYCSKTKQDTSNARQSDDAGAHLAPGRHLGASVTATAA
jgi:hypothetical protein